jgi:hypothetical protein
MIDIVIYIQRFVLLLGGSDTGNTKLGMRRAKLTNSYGGKLNCTTSFGYD